MNTTVEKDVDRIAVMKAVRCLHLREGRQLTALRIYLGSVTFLPINPSEIDIAFAQQDPKPCVSDKGKGQRIIYTSKRNISKQAWLKIHITIQGQLASSGLAPSSS